MLDFILDVIFLIFICYWNGYLIKNRNQNAYLKKVDDLVKDASMRKQLGKNARESIKPYQKEKVVSKWISLLESEKKK